MIAKQTFFNFVSILTAHWPDYPFDDLFKPTVLMHADNRKWYTLVMRVSRRKFGFDSDGLTLRNEYLRLG